MLFGLLFVCGFVCSGGLLGFFCLFVLVFIFFCLLGLLDPCIVIS